MPLGPDSVKVLVIAVASEGPLSVAGTSPPIVTTRPAAPTPRVPTLPRFLSFPFVGADLLAVLEGEIGSEVSWFGVVGGGD